MPRVCIAITYRNSALTIPFAIKSALLQQGIEPVFVLLDADSVDESTLFAIDLLKSRGVEYVYDRARCNIAQGRNKLLKMCLSLDPDYVFFLDADTVLRYRNDISLATELSKQRNVIYLRYNFENYQSPPDLVEKAMSYISNAKNRDLTRFETHKAHWCPLGATLIPRKLAEILEFDEDLSFAEDRYFGYMSWRCGYPIKVVESSPLPATDINLGTGSIYISMPLREYLRGLHKKILWDRVWLYFDPKTMRYLNNLVKKARLHRYLPYLALDIVSIALPIARGIEGLALSIALFTLYTAFLAKAKKIGFLKALENMIKFNIYGVSSLLLSFPLYLRHRKEFKNIFYYIMSYSDGANHERSTRSSSLDASPRMPRRRSMS